MNRLALYLMSAAAALSVTSAHAADLPVKAAPLAPTPVLTWTGFYLGGNAGYSWGDWDRNGLGGIASPSVDGWVLGLQAGYNWQVSPVWVVGVEGDIQITGQKASEFGALLASDVAGGPPPFTDPAAFHTITTGSFGNEWKLPWFATFRGRIGGLVDPSLLIYATGGLAVGQFEGSSAAVLSSTTYRGQIGTTTNPVLGPVVAAGAGFSDSTTQLGWTVGAGLEKKFTPNWSAKAEYLYMDYGTHSFGPLGLAQVKLRDNIARVGVNYQFR
jgi:outer membrane immunogenic protein